MGVPTPEQITAATAALRTDATMWSTAADDMNTASAIASGLYLSAVDFSYVGEKVGLTTVYRQLQDKLTRLCAEARDTFTTLSASLDKAADGYDADEARAVHRMTGIY